MEKGIVLGNPLVRVTHMGERKVCALDIETRHLFVTYFGIWKEKLSIKIALQP